MGNVYVADPENHRVQKWAPGASAGITVAGGQGRGSAAFQLDYPTDVSVDPTENIFINDAGNERIQKWGPGASTGITVAGGYYATGLFVDVSGYIYNIDGVDGVLKWPGNGSAFVTVAGQSGWGSASNQLLAAKGIFVDAFGNVYVADWANHRIQVFEPNKVGFSLCSRDMVVEAPLCSDKATIEWAEPRETFPNTIQALPQDTFTFIGAINGHGYYKSNTRHLWPQAQELSKLVGSNSARGHLVILNNEVENTYVFNQIRRSGHAYWIGLFNSGTVGSFRWVENDSLAYSNWYRGEPNNAGGNSGYIGEPFVRMSDLDGKWNDQPDDYLPFVVEFDKPLIRYKQISGPENGSSQQAGVYQICYERRDLVANTVDTCCFEIKVICSPASVRTVPSVVESIARDTERPKVFDVFISPNPSQKHFTVKMSGNSKEQVGIQISDLAGRVIETMNGLSPNQKLNIEEI